MEVSHTSTEARSHATRIRHGDDGDKRRWEEEEPRSKYTRPPSREGHSHGMSSFDKTFGPRPKTEERSRNNSDPTNVKGSRSNTSAALASLGMQRTLGEQPRQNREALPSLEHVRPSPKVMSSAEPENTMCCSPPASSTAAPSEISSCRSSRRSSSSSRSHLLGALAGYGNCPAAPVDAVPTSPAKQPARSQSVGGSRPNSRAGSRPNSRADSQTAAQSSGAGGTRGDATPELRNRAGSSHGSRAQSGSVTPQQHSRAPSGSRTPEHWRGKEQQMGPLLNAALESASQKLAGLERGADRPRCRTVWDEEADKYNYPLGEREPWQEGSMPSTGGQGNGTSILPVAPGEKSPKRRPHGRAIAGERPVSRGTSYTKKSVNVGVSEDRSSGSNSSKSTSEKSSHPERPLTSMGNHALQPAKDSRNPRLHLRNGSRDDSFLSTISESTRSSDSNSTDRDSKINALDGSQIEVFSENQVADKRMYVDILKDFSQLFKHMGEKNGEHMQQLLRNDGVDKPLEMQRRIIPLIMSAFQDEQKSFITVQGAPQCGKTSALALGILGAVNADMPGIRAIALSTGPVRDFKKCFDICADVHPIKLAGFESTRRRVSFEGEEPDSDPAVHNMNLNEDMQRLSTELPQGAPATLFGHPSRVLPLLREAPSWGIDLSNVQVLALDDAEEAICQGLIDEVCEVCTILRHFSKQRLRHIILSHFLSNEAKSMVRCLRTSLLRQQNLFGIRAHRTQARAKAVNHYYAVAPRQRWPAMLAVLHHALSLPSGIIFDDESAEARAHTRVALRALGVTASVWNALQEQRSGARAAARDGAAGAPKGPAFHLMPSDLVVLKVDLPQVRCVLHFEVPRRELSIYGLRLMCLEQQDQKKSRKAGLGGKSLSVLFVEEAEVVRELEKTFHVRMHEVPTEMLPN